MSRRPPCPACKGKTSRDRKDDAGFCFCHSCKQVLHLCSYCNEYHDTKPRCVDRFNAPRGLSVQQPWPSLIESGDKTIELRSWYTHYRGPLLICASGKPWKGDHGHRLGPMGVTICVVDLVDCRDFNLVEDLKATCIPKRLSHGLAGFSWVLDNPRTVERKPTKGRLNLFRLDDEQRAVARAVVDW